MTLSSPRAPRGSETGGLRALLQRGWIAVTVAVIAGIAGAAAVTKVETKQYTASASVLVTLTGVSDSASLANARTSGTINLDTEAQLAKSTQTAKRVQELDPSRKSTPTATLLKNLTITVPPNTQVLRMNYTATSPATAAQTANDFATAYLDARSADAQGTLDAQINKLSDTLRTKNTQLNSVSDQLTTLPANSKARSYASAQRGLLISAITTLNTLFNSLSATVITPGQLLSEATIPGKASSPSLPLNLATGLAAGLLIGLAIAWLRFAKLRRMSRPDDVVRLIRLPVISTITRLQDGMVESAGSPQAAQYQRIVNLLGASVGDAGIILLTGAAPATPTDTVAANLAASLAHTGVPVCVLSLTSTADRLAPQTTTAVRFVERNPDLGDVGAISRARLDRMRSNGYLIIATDDPCSSADAQTLASLSDAVLLVVAAQSKVNDGRSAIDDLDAVGAPVLGAVLVPGSKQHHLPSSSASEAELPTPDIGSQGEGKSDSTSPSERSTGRTSQPLRPPSTPDGGGGSNQSRARSTAVGAGQRRPSADPSKRSDIPPKERRGASASALLRSRSRARLDRSRR
ncbi:MAG: Wzz/FepE/Etk N-terminal domain-containing protein [Jatrophihabitans sp.]